MKNKTVIAYKGFDKNLCCRGFQYEIGKEYETDKAQVCDEGFHACERPADVFTYYPPATSRYCIVELSGELSRDADDSKIASTKIKIVAEIGIRGIVNAQKEYEKTHKTKEHVNVEHASAGDRGVATAGYRGVATAGDSGVATAGDCGVATAGYCGAATAGYCGAASAGDCGAATAGDCGVATAGYCGAAASRGSSDTGENGLSVARGNNVRVKGGMGAMLVICVEETGSYAVAAWKCAVVDGETIKADTWYRLVDGEFTEDAEG